MTEKVQGSNLRFIEIARKFPNDAFCYLLPLVNSSVLGVSVRTERQRVSETYSYNEEETESDSTNLVWKLFEIRYAKLLVMNEFSRYQGTPEENWSENVKNFVWVKPKTAQAF